MSENFFTVFWSSKTGFFYDWQPINIFWRQVTTTIGIKNPSCIFWADGSFFAWNYFSELTFLADPKTLFLVVFWILTFRGISSPGFTPHCLCKDWRRVFRSQESIEIYPALPGFKLALLATCSKLQPSIYLRVSSTNHSASEGYPGQCTFLIVQNHGNTVARSFITQL